MSKKILVLMSTNNKLVFVYFKSLDHVEYVHPHNLELGKKWRRVGTPLTKRHFKIYNILKYSELADYYKQLKVEELLQNIPLYDELESDPTSLKSLCIQHMETKDEK